VPSFHDLSVGEALSPDLLDRENSGGGKCPSQISRRNDQPESPGTEEKISQPFHLNSNYAVLLKSRVTHKFL
jgi:hypothetical protein